MPKTDNHKAIAEAIKGIKQELRKQQAINENLLQRIDNLEKTLFQKEQAEENEQDSPNSSSIKSEFNYSETEKERALTTYNFSAFSIFLEEFKSNLHHSFFVQERLEIVRECYGAFLIRGPKKVLESAIRKNDKVTEEFTPNSREREKRTLLQHLDKEFDALPDIYCEAWEE